MDACERGVRKIYYDDEDVDGQVSAFMSSLRQFRAIEGKFSRRNDKFEEAFLYTLDL